MVVEACVGADVGFIHAKSEGLEGARSTTKRLWQTTAAFRGLFAINDKWFVSASIAAVFALGPASFVYQRNNGRAEKSINRRTCRSRAPSAWRGGSGDRSENLALPYIHGCAAGSRYPRASTQIVIF
jgi:hypothetical protein